MTSNTKLFDYSLQNPEPLIDNVYIKINELIISSSRAKPNQLMKINQELLDNITAYRIAANQGNKKMQLNILKTIHSLMQNKGLNFSEFASFWAVIDVSYSLYRLLPDTEQLKFLESAIKKYLEMRHEIYLDHGYSTTTLQVGKDAKAHKGNASLGIKKAASILTKNGYTQLTHLTLDSFNSSDKIFLFTDKNGKKLFKNILKTSHIKFRWSSKSQNKMPDVLFKNSNNIYIVEHKHMKEIGGGQNKQVSEVIDFVGYSESSSISPVHYVTFMDGLYFNLFKQPSESNEKLLTQKANIQTNLKANQNNYFVNTAGFHKLLKEISAAQ